MDRSTLVGGFLAVAFPFAIELTAHVIVHYTIPGAAFAADIAKTVAPALDAIGLQSSFTAAATTATSTATTATTSIASAATSIDQLPNLSL